MKKLFLLFPAVTAGLLVGIASAQEFSLDAYQSFLDSHKDLTSSQLYSIYPAGAFRSKTTTDLSTAAYFDSIDVKYSLTDYEKSLISKNGFMVTERIAPTSFGNAFLDVYTKDLPVFVSTDAILHSIHMSYDAILMKTEQTFLIYKLDTLLARLQNGLPLLASKYSAYPEMNQEINDVDVYLTVPRILLGSVTAPLYSVNTGEVDTLIRLINAEMPGNYPIFASIARTIDFSQFTPRGHYTLTPDLTKYFQAMIWLGRIEIYLTKPTGTIEPPTDADVQRQTIDAVLIKELADTTGSFPLLDNIDGVLKFFVGESDNVTLSNISSLCGGVGITDAQDLLDTLKWRAFQDTLISKPFAFQRILSQILLSDPMSPDKIEPASSFLLLGQRFVIDSYVLGNVVYDKVPTMRMLPSTLDVLFAEGNDAAGQLLQPELDKYEYASNLAALRYLIDSYGQDFWLLSMYNAWSDAIRALNPPTNRDTLPAFMRTAAWWQEKMNTQLAAWAQLRHDNLLYAKQSYTGGVGCSYPESYVEPVPQFYDAVMAYADIAEKEFENPPLADVSTADYFRNVRAIADTLGGISRKELAGMPLGDAEKTFLQNMMYTVHSGECGALPYDGWYPKLFFAWSRQGPAVEKNLVVADVHTAPTDEYGDPVGWVLHVGTGPVNMAVVVAPGEDGNATAFIGPVMSYYEDLQTGFNRLTDEEWQTAYDSPPAMRPSWANIYLADSAGASLGSGPSLLTGINDGSQNDLIPSRYLLSQNYPNPFNPTTMINYQLPINSRVSMKVYDILGREVATIVDGYQTAGYHNVKFDGSRMASGIYFVRLNAGTFSATRKILLLK